MVLLANSKNRLRLRRGVALGNHDSPPVCRQIASLPNRHAGRFSNPAVLGRSASARVAYLNVARARQGPANHAALVPVNQERLSVGDELRRIAVRFQPLARFSAPGPELWVVDVWHHD